MTRNLLPLRKTGWLYLLLVLWSLLFWLASTGSFASLNQWNREQLFRLLPGQLVASKVARIVSPLTSAQLPPLQQLFQLYPELPVVLLGNPSKELLNQLQNHLNQAPHAAGVYVATHEAASVGEITYRMNPDSWFNAGLDSVRLDQPAGIQWRASSYLVYAPLLGDSDARVSLLWRQQKKNYLSLAGELLKETPGQTVHLTGQWNLALETKDPQSNQIQTWPLGFGAAIYSAGQIPSAQPLNEFLGGAKVADARVIFIDDLTQPSADTLIRTTSRLLERKYLYQSMPLLLVPVCLLLLGLLLLWLIRGWRLSRQVVALSGYLVSLGALQYIAFTQMQWLAVLPVALTLLISGLVLQGYRREAGFYAQLQDRHNHLLGEAVAVFYQAQKIERLQPLLELTQPDFKLAEKIFDVALQAEARNNRSLAKNLLSYIQQSGLKHPASAQKLSEMTPQAKAASLDSTMVIEPGQNQTQTFANSHLAVENFGRYKIEGILGKGAMGIVYQGVDPKINRHVAIKTLQLIESDDNDHLGETKARFFREAETAGNLSHANIVTIYDVGEEGELGYIAMDLLTGAPLSAFTKPRNRLPAPLIYQLMIQITDALDYAHRQNVVHRDIKPGNIIFDDEIQRVTITDFGIAFVADNSKTRTGTIMGSPYYMSPEQVLGKRVDGRSDIFSLGVTFYQLLSGHLPFDGESIASVTYHIINTKQTSVRQWDDRLPASAARITNKAMQKEASKRYQSMDEFKQALISGLKRDFKKAPIV